MRAGIVLFVVILAGCVSNVDPGAPVAHDAQFDMIPLDTEAPYVHVVEASPTNVTLHVGGLASGGDIPEGADNGVKGATLSGTTLRVELESHESQTASGKLTPIWIVSLHGVAAGKYTLEVKISKASCTSADACTTSKSVSASSPLNVTAT